jgi:hypothetical protein
MCVAIELSLLGMVISPSIGPLHADIISVCKGKNHTTIFDITDISVIYVITVRFKYYFDSLHEWSVQFAIDRSESIS